MNRLKASAALICTLLIAWSQIIQPYCAYALSAQSVASSQSVQQSSNDCGFQGESSQDGRGDALGSQGVTEWYGDAADAARPDGSIRRCLVTRIVNARLIGTDSRLIVRN